MTDLPAAWRALLTAHAAAVGRIERDLAAAGRLPLTWYDVLLELAAAPGRAALRRTWPAYARGIQEHFARHLTAEEARVLATALARVRAAAAADGRGGEGPPGPGPGDRRPPPRGAQREGPTPPPDPGVP